MQPPDETFDALVNATVGALLELDDQEAGKMIAASADLFVELVRDLAARRQRQLLN
jgi:hypothetical protein